MKNMSGRERRTPSPTRRSGFWKRAERGVGPVFENDAGIISLETRLHILEGEWTNTLDKASILWLLVK